MIGCFNNRIFYVGRSISGAREREKREETTLVKCKQTNKETKRQKEER